MEACWAHYCNDATKLYTTKMQKMIQIYKIAGRDKQPYFYGWHEDICQEWKITKNFYTRYYNLLPRYALWGVATKTTRHQLYGHLPPVTKTIQFRRTRHAGHCWRSKDELISNVILWTPAYGRAKAWRPAQTYIQQLCEDTGCSPEAMNDREKRRERVRDIRASCMTWWWWCQDIRVEI